MNDVMLILHRADGAVCLAERRGTGYADSLLNLPSGKAEPDEDIFDAVIREAREEIGIDHHLKGEPFSSHWHDRSDHHTWG